MTDTFKHAIFAHPRAVEADQDAVEQSARFHWTAAVNASGYQPVDESVAVELEPMWKTSSGYVDSKGYDEEGNETFARVDVSSPPDMFLAVAQGAIQ